MVLTKRLYNKTHKDINRDFPYLTKDTACMESIGARVVNELYINHMFSLALSLHGGTESLTYPYGTPNHIHSKNVPKLPIYYNQDKNGRLQINVAPETNSLVEQFRNLHYEMIVGKSTNPPDYNAVKSIAESASDHTTNNPKRKYKTGDMNGEVYSVTGGMEDWAYSGSWEGAPVITQPCKPTTYNGYEPKKTMYDNYYKDSLKSIMFLLEVSNEKVPEQKLLGRKNIDCLLNLRSNAFFNNLAPNKKVCLDDYIDGYIPRIIRLSLTLIDLLNPYVNFLVQPVKNKNLLVTWTIGGAINIDSSFILYGFFEEQPSKEIIDKLNYSTNIMELKSLLKNSSRNYSGKAVWNIDYSAADRFKYLFKSPNKKGNYLVFIIIGYVDKNWSLKNHPDPDINPQTHIANFRTNPNYTASNACYTIKGQEFFRSSVKVIYTKNIKK